MVTGREASKYKGFMGLEPMEPMEPCHFPSWVNPALNGPSNLGKLGLIVMGFDLASGEDGGRGPLHGIAHRVDRKARINARRILALVP